MKCKKCGHVNRKGAKHCKECGELLAATASLVCPSCGKKVQKTAKFCDDCGTELTASAPPAVKPRLLREEQSTPPPVVVSTHESKKRRLNPLWLILPLLVVICCCGLMLLFQGRVPGFAAPYVDPIINPINEQVERVLPGLSDILQPREDSCDELRNAYPVCFEDAKPEDIIAGPKPVEREDQDKQPVDQGEECNDFANRVAGVEDLYKGGIDNCEGPPWTCEYVFEDITGLDLDDYNDLGINYQWGDGPLREATCVGAPDNFRCRFQIEPDIDGVVFYITLGKCEEYLSSWNDWVEPAKEEDIIAAQEQEKEEDDISELKECKLEFSDANCGNFYYNILDNMFDNWQPDVVCDFDKKCELNGDNIAPYLAGQESDFIDCIEIYYSWESEEEGTKADCYSHPTDFRCQFPFEPDKDLRSIGIGLSGCSTYHVASIPLEEIEFDKQLQEENLAPQSSDSCPAPDNITFMNFAVEDGGWYSFDLINELPWEQDIFYGDLYKGDGELWHKYECTIDENDNKRMDCGSAPGESNLGTAAGWGYLMFDPDVFGSSCSTELKVPANYGTVAAPEPPSEDEGCLLFSEGICFK